MAKTWITTTSEMMELLNSFDGYGLVTTDDSQMIARVRELFVCVKEGNEPDHEDYLIDDYKEEDKDYIEGVNSPVGCDFCTAPTGFHSHDCPYHEDNLVAKEGGIK